MVLKKERVYPLIESLRLRKLPINHASQRLRQLHASGSSAADSGRTDAGALKGRALQRQRDRWLQLHDKQTGGIMGLLPCVRGLPVRFTETVDREKRIFKNIRGVLGGWELSDLDAERVRD